MYLSSIVGFSEGKNENVGETEGISEGIFDVVGVNEIVGGIDFVGATVGISLAVGALDSDGCVLGMTETEGATVPSRLRFSSTTPKLEETAEAAAAATFVTAVIGLISPVAAIEPAVKPTVETCATVVSSAPVGPAAPPDPLPPFPPFPFPPPPVVIPLFKSPFITTSPFPAWAIPLSVVVRVPFAKDSRVFASSENVWSKTFSTISLTRILVPGLKCPNTSTPPSWPALSPSILAASSVPG
mmetsp:Transcript_15404/g.36592  ORF Transcript_15404/g.36592 Transcript_15404/m.36592 type:complete len:242 (-) Transcript_15404:233-958(-)